MATGSGVDEGGFAMVRVRGDKSGDVKGMVGWKWKGNAFAVESRIGRTKPTLGIDS